MKSAVIATAAFSVLAARAHPAIDTRAPPPGLTDQATLNFALTLEHIEDTFYRLQLSRFSAQDFHNANLPDGARQQLIEIGEHETEHVDFLTGLLGSKATKPCIYRFPVNTPMDFAKLSQVFENVGVGAYTGAIASLSKQYITGSASILGTEARQASLIAGYINGVEGWGGAWNAPLTMSQAYTLAASFIVRCPTDNPPLPVRVFPPLIFPPNASPGKTVTVMFRNPFGPSTKLWAVFLSGRSLQPDFVLLNRGKVTIPTDLAGQVYCIISASETSVADHDTIAGPALLQFDFSLTGQPVMKA